MGDFRDKWYKNVNTIEPQVWILSSWNVATGQREFQIQHKKTKLIALSPDGQILIALDEKHDSVRMLVLEVKHLVKLVDDVRGGR